MRFAAAAFLSTLALAQPETRSFKVLAAPNESVDAASWKAKDIEAHIGKLQYKVQAVQPLGSAGKTIIVLDFGSTSATLHACLLAEALSALDRLPQVPRPVLVAADYAPDFTTDVKFDGRGEYVVYGGNDSEKLRNTCEGGKPRRGRYPGSSGGFGSISLFATLSNVFGPTDGPVRVYWLSQYFDWFDLRSAPNSSTLANPRPDPDPNIAFRHIRSISNIDLTVFPIVFGDRRNDHLESPGREQIKGANYMAHYLGGFATPITGGIGDTLVRVFEETQHSALVWLSGPVTREKKVTSLVVRMAGLNGIHTWERPFVVNDGRSDIHAAGWEKLPDWSLTPLVLGRINFRVEFGCSVPDADPQPSLRITLPPEVTSAAPGTVEIQLHYQNEKGLATQRLDVDRPTNPAEPLCIPLIHARSGTKFSLIVRDASTGWIGATDGTLVKNGGQ